MFEATEYTVVPDTLDQKTLDYELFQPFMIKISFRDVGENQQYLWAVTRFSQCLNRDGEWDWEPSPSNRSEEFVKEHRFYLDEAISLAEEAVEKLIVNGKTFAEWEQDPLT